MFNGRSFQTWYKGSSNGSPQRNHEQPVITRAPCHLFFCLKSQNFRTELELGNYLFVLYMRNLKAGVLNWLAQGHSADGWHQSMTRTGAQAQGPLSYNSCSRAYSSPFPCTPQPPPSTWIPTLFEIHAVFPVSLPGVQWPCCRGFREGGMSSSGNWNALCNGRG